MKHPLLLLCSALVGLASAFLAANAPEGFSDSMLSLGLGSGVLALVVFAVVMWLRMRLCHMERRANTPPDRLVRRHGLRFLGWFIGHNLLWATGSSLCIAALLGTFQSRPWAVAVSAGLFACTACALAGALSAVLFLFARRFETLGLCWRSAVPNGVSNFGARASATMILRDRFEYAKERDPKLFRLIVVILDLARAGGADQTVSLLERVSNALKKESANRFFVLTPLFIVVCILALLALTIRPPGGETQTPVLLSRTVAASPSPGDATTASPQPGQTVTTSPSPGGTATAPPQPSGTAVAPSPPGEGTATYRTVAASPPPDGTGVAPPAPATPIPSSIPPRTPDKEPPSPREPQPVPLPPWEMGEVVTLTLLPFAPAQEEGTPGAPTPSTPYPTPTEPTSTPAPAAAPAGSAKPVQHIPNWIWALLSYWQE